MFILILDGEGIFAEADSNDSISQSTHPAHHPLHPSVYCPSFENEIVDQPPLYGPNAEANGAVYATHVVQMPLPWNNQVYTPNTRYNYYPHRVHHTPDQLNPWNPYHRNLRAPNAYTNDAYWSNGYDSHFPPRFQQLNQERHSPVPRAQRPFVVDISSSDDESNNLLDEARNFRLRQKRRRCSDCDSPTLHGEQNNHENGNIMNKHCRQHANGERNDDQNDALNLTSRPINLSNHVNRNSDSDELNFTNELKPNIDDLNRTIKIEKKETPSILNVKREIKTEGIEDNDVTNNASSIPTALQNIKIE